MFVKRRRHAKLVSALLMFGFFIIVIVVTVDFQVTDSERPKTASPRKEYKNVRNIIELNIINATRNIPQKRIDEEAFYTNLTLRNRSLCSIHADDRGPHQKVLSYSIFGPASRNFENAMFTWNKHIELLSPLVLEAAELFPDWVIRIYVDFAGSSEFHKQALADFTNVDVCDMAQLPVFSSSLLNFLPGRMWRFLPVFDPLVDFVLSRDLDSPLVKRDHDTIDLWMLPTEQQNFFHIVRDHDMHGTEILAGLWGAALSRARRELLYIFYPMLQPSLALTLGGSGDQVFLSRYVWPYVRHHALVFDSYLCELYVGKPFPSRRPSLSCFLGCIRPCCDVSSVRAESPALRKPCPVACRPKEHQDWEYC